MFQWAHSNRPLFYLVMPVLWNASESQHLEDRCHAKLDAIRRRYNREPNPKLKAAHLRLLKEFADLVIRGKRPRVY